ncbi:MAG: penicillin-binding protein activator [Rhodocyclaceae bacterium]|nr:penicillin-binding protein activator [Rhodocyclaceae bacterium]
MLRSAAPILSAVCLLYGAALGRVTEVALAQQEQQEQPATTAAENTPQESGKPDEPAAGGAAQPGAQSAQRAPAAKAHVALILPIKSPGLGRLAEAVRLGATAAAAADGDETSLALVTYPTGDDVREIVSAYEAALRQGARLVIGPLAKPAVHALAKSGAVSVPTLALSVPDADLPPPANLYFFGLPLEAEARQVAQLAQSQGRRRAAILVMDNALSRRLAQSFTDEWTRAGRQIVGQHMFTSEAAQLRKIRDAMAAANADMIFFALDAQRARQVRPYLGKTLATYATSQVHAPANDVVGQHDLNGLVFVDMPWLLVPDHPAVLGYRRPSTAFPATDQDRFYALGIDAWRLGQALLGDGLDAAGSIDGVTGDISLGPGHQFRREPVAAQFVQGVPRLIGPAAGR